MTVFLVFWLVLLTAAIVVGGLMIVGKFARMQRDINEHESQIFTDEGESEIGVLHGVFDALLNDFQNLQVGFENLLTKVKTLEENPSEVSEQISQLETRFSDLTENLENLRGDVNLVLRADKEHPVLAPANKGGRPRKDI